MSSKGRLLAQAITESRVLSAALTETAETPSFPITKKYTNIDLLPSSGTIGDIAFVESTNRLYIWNGNGWYNIALINTNPSFDSGGGPEASYILDSGGGIPTVIQLSANDPEGIPIQWSYVASDSAQYFADITNDSSVFTITAKSTSTIEQYDSTGGVFSVTFRASDGVNLATALSEFTIKFGINWASSTFYEFSTTDLIRNPTDGEYFSGMASISPDGTLALIGSGGDRLGFNSLGGLNIFRLSGTSWIPETVLFADPAGASNGFAGGITNLFPTSSISCSDDNNTIVVGAPTMTIGGNSFTGAMFIFNYSSGSWTQSAYFNTQNYFASADNRYGNLVRISGDGETVIVGVPRWDTSATDVGGLIVYRKINNIWALADGQNNSTPGAGLPLSLTGTSRYAGHSGDINYDGTTVAFSNRNIVEIFTRSGTPWTSQASLTLATENYINSISLTQDGNVLAIGCPYNSSSRGAVLIWERTGSTWNQTHTIIDSELPSDSKFGHQVSISYDGKILAIEKGDGYTFDLYGIGREIYVYEKQADGSWLQVKKIQKHNDKPIASGRQGVTLAKKTGAALITTPLDNGGQFNPGVSITVDVHTAG